MGGILSYHYRRRLLSNNDWVKVRPFSPDRNEFMLKLGVVVLLQDICRDREEQVAWRCIFRSDCRAVLCWNLFCCLVWACSA